MGIHVIAYLGTSIFLAGIVRGYSGFGFSMIAITCLSLVMPPAEAVPVILLLENIASASLLPQVWRQIDWPSLFWLFAGVVFGTPVGVYFLATISPNAMRMAIAVIVIILSICMLGGVSRKEKSGPVDTVATGVTSGVLNGAATIGGPPVILFYLSSPTGMAVSRATLIAYFFGTDFLAAGFCLVHGLLDTKIGILGITGMVPMLIGVGLGSLLFKRTKIEAFRSRVLMVLIILSVIGLLRSIFNA